MWIIISIIVVVGILAWSLRPVKRPEGCVCTGTYNRWMMDISPECPVHRHHLEADLLHESADLESLRKK